jgi:hypothetical protein
MDELPRPGAPILLAVAGQTWRTQLLEGDEASLLVSLGEMPPAQLLSMELGTRVSCRFHDQQALSTFESTLRGLVQSNGQMCLMLERPGRITRSQRRQYVRVDVKVEMQLRLMLRNDALTRARGQEFTQLCWVQAMAVNISAGGFRATLSLPALHSVVAHREAHVRFELGGERFRDRRVAFLRRDPGDEAVFIYTFADLSRAEIERIEGINLSRLHAGASSEEKGDA